jgi:hypothetical protein
MEWIGSEIHPKHELVYTVVSLAERRSKIEMKEKFAHIGDVLFYRGSI